MNEKDKKDRKSALNEVLTNILIPSLKYAEKEINVYVNLDEEFKNKILRKYDSIRSDFRRDFMEEDFAKNPEKRIGKCKVAAIFYIAFVDIAKETGFKNFKNEILNNDDVIYLFVHNVAFNTAMGIMENFICAEANYKEYAKEKEYHLYIEKCGIIAGLEKYADYVIKEFIAEHKNDSLSLLSLINIFRSIERNSEEIFKKQKKII